MNAIKFSHKYFKLNTQARTAVLLDVLNVNLEDISDRFKAYDTEYFTPDRKMNYYKLPKKGKFMLLIFRDDGFCIFTTLRRWLPAKEKYYRGLIGQNFHIVIEEEKV